MGIALTSAELPQVVAIADKADPPPFWVRRLAAAIPGQSHVELAPQAPGRRNLWAAQLDEIVRRADRPVLLLAYGISCFAVGWWARLSPAAYVDPVGAAVLVRPLTAELARGRARREPTGPNTPFPFTTVVIDDSADDARSAVHARELARGWGSGFVDLAHPDLVPLMPSLRTTGTRERLVRALLGVVAEWQAVTPAVGEVRLGE